jgi:hypothetical protein
MTVIYRSINPSQRAGRNQFKVRVGSFAKIFFYHLLYFFVVADEDTFYSFSSLFLIDRLVSFSYFFLLRILHIFSIPGFVVR